MLHEGQVIVDRYIVENTIAHGGMATVYRVSHQQLKSQHALKVLDLPTANIRSRLLQEGRIQASLRHPNIVAVTDALEVDGHPALVMEYVDGPSLAELLEEKGALDLATVERWFTAIVQAVKYAHGQGLVHRDLKPDNVLMAPLSGGYLVKVADFGIAKVVQEYMDERNEGVKTRTGVGMGTPAYMPPEQVTNAGKVDHRADIFSLGAILYEMCTGNRAFPGESLLSIYNAAAEGEYEPPGIVRSDLPDRFIAAIEGCLEPHPDQRFGSCQELLDVFTGSRVVSPRTPAPRGERSSRITKRSNPIDVKAPPPKKSRMGTVLSVFIVLVLVGLLTVFVVVTTGFMVGGMWWANSLTPTTSTNVMGWQPTSAMHKFDVTLHSWRRTQHLENGPITYDAESAATSLYIFEMSVDYLDDDTHMPAAPWTLVESNGVAHDADMACGMALHNPIPPFRTYSQGERVRGPICFEAPANATGMRLRFKPDPIHGDAFWFDVLPEDEES